MLGGALQEMFNVDAGGNITGVKPYTPYSTNVNDYFAGFSPLQQQAQANAANLQMPGQYNMATELAGNAGLGAFMTADQTNQYGARAFDAGQGAMSLATPAAYAGAEYGRQVTDPSVYQQYMSPYMQAVTNNQIEGLVGNQIYPRTPDRRAQLGLGRLVGRGKLSKTPKRSGGCRAL